MLSDWAQHVLRGGQRAAKTVWCHGNLMPPTKILEWLVEPREWFVNLSRLTKDGPQKTLPLSKNQKTVNKKPKRVNWAFRIKVSMLKLQPESSWLHLILRVVSALVSWWGEYSLVWIRFPQWVWFCKIYSTLLFQKTGLHLLKYPCKYLWPILKKKVVCLYKWSQFVSGQMP